MSAPTLKPTKIYGWDGFELSSDEVSVGITPSMGGRIMSLKYQGYELLFVDPKHTAEVFNPNEWSDLTKSKELLGFRVWGGDKTWVAPQADWLCGIPPLDLDAASYALNWENDCAVMTSPVCRETGLQIIRRVSCHEGQVHLTEELYNRSTRHVHKGLWNVTQVKRPCFVMVPVEEKSFRDYYDQDKTLLPFKGDLSVKQGQVRIDCRTLNIFKVGGMPSHGELAIYFDCGIRQICWTKHFSYVAQASYAHDSAVEVFNSPSHPYAEVELHAPFSVLAPQECVRLEQSWQISSCSSKHQGLQ